jgi:phage portal protein BeeE
VRPLARLAGRPRNALHPPFWSQPSFFGSLSGERETIEANFEAHVRRAYKANGVVFACVLARLLLFSEARFQWRRFELGRPGELFDDGGLRLLAEPWTNGTTGELLGRMEQDASLAGNSYWTAVGRGGQARLRRMRPDWVTIVTGVRRDELDSPDERPGPFDLRARPVAVVYQPRGVARSEPVILAPEQVAHYSPIPDPEAQWRGMSWLTTVLREIEADSAATTHKSRYFQHGATPGIAVTYDAGVSPEDFDEYVKRFKEQHTGASNAYKTLHFGGGSDAKVLSHSLKQIDFKVTQGAGETRIAAAACVPPIIVGLSEGLQASTYSNYGQAKRKFADTFARPHWRMAAASLQRLFTPPAGAQLWYDDRDIAFLRDDARDAAETVSINSRSIRTYTDAGFTPESAVAAVDTGDVSRLDHTGLFSVQLQPPGSTTAADSARVPAAAVPALLAAGWTVATEDPREGTP